MIGPCLRCKRILETKAYRDEYASWICQPEGWLNLLLLDHSKANTSKTEVYRDIKGGIQLRAVHPELQQQASQAYYCSISDRISLA